MISQRFMRFWMTEAIRQQEAEHGPLADNSANRRAQSAASAEEFALQRAEHLAHAQQLQPAFLFYQRALRLAFWLSILFASLSGIALALNLAPQANRDISLIEAVSVAILTNALFILLWLVAVLRKQAPGGPGHWLLQSVQRFTGDQHRFLAAQSHTHLCARQGLLKPGFSVFSHSLWSTILGAAFIALTLRFLVYDYQFVWRTTLLSAAQIEALISAMHILPGMLGIERPLIDSATQVAANPRDTAIWLLSCILIYAFMPRILLLCASEWIRRRRLRKLSLDWSLPGLIELRPVYDRQQVIDVDPAPADIEVFPQRKARQSPAPTTGRALLISLEWPAEQAQQLSSLFSNRADWEWLANISSASERNECLSKLANLSAKGAQTPPQVYLVINPLLSPDRGSLRFIEAVSQLSSVVIVVALAGSQRGKLWQQTMQQHLPELALAITPKSAEQDLSNTDAQTVWEQCIADITEATNQCKA